MPTLPANVPMRCTMPVLFPNSAKLPTNGTIAQFPNHRIQVRVIVRPGFGADKVKRIPRGRSVELVSVSDPYVLGSAPPGPLNAHSYGTIQRIWKSNDQELLWRKHDTVNAVMQYIRSGTLRVHYQSGNRQRHSAGSLTTSNPSALGISVRPREAPSHPAPYLCVRVICRFGVLFHPPCHPPNTLARTIAQFIPRTNEVDQEYMSHVDPAGHGREQSRLLPLLDYLLYLMYLTSLPRPIAPSISPITLNAC